MSVPGSPRLPWADVPADVRRRVDGLLGSPVVAVSPRGGGFSPGPAVEVTRASGRRAFVKAVGTPLNPDTPDLLRTEARVAAALPHHLPVPRFLGAVDDGEGQKDSTPPTSSGPPILPTIRAFQRRFHDTTLAWAQTRARLALW